MLDSYCIFNGQISQILNFGSLPSFSLLGNWYRLNCKWRGPIRSTIPASFNSIGPIVFFNYFKKIKNLSVLHFLPSFLLKYLRHVQTNESKNNILQEALKESQQIAINGGTSWFSSVTSITKILNIRPENMSKMQINLAKDSKKQFCTQMVWILATPK